MKMSVPIGKQKKTVKIICGSLISQQGGAAGWVGCVLRSLVQTSAVQEILVVLLLVVCILNPLVERSRNVVTSYSKIFALTGDGLIHLVLVTGLEVFVKPSIVRIMEKMIVSLLRPMPLAIAGSLKGFVARRHHVVIGQIDQVIVIERNIKILT